MHSHIYKSLMKQILCVLLNVFGFIAYHESQICLQKTAKAVKECIIIAHLNVHIIINVCNKTDEQK